MPDPAIEPDSQRNGRCTFRDFFVREFFRPFARLSPASGAECRKDTARVVAGIVSLFVLLRTK